MKNIADRAPTANGLDHGRAQGILAFLCRLLAESDRVSLPELLHELAEKFGAKTAGLTADGPSAIVGETPDRNGTGKSFPWHGDAALLEKIRKSPSGLIVESDRNWLVTAVSEDWLLWAEGPARHSWTTEDTPAFHLAGQMLGRLAATQTHGTGWTESLRRSDFRRRLEGTALVTRRLAHDFGNVLTGILGFAELTLAQLPLESPLRKPVKEVVTSAQQAADWVRRLQGFSRQNRPKGKLSKLGPVLWEEAECLRQAWGGSIALLVAAPDDLPAIAIDGEALREVLRQLLENAREAIHDRGVVSVSVRPVELGAESCLELLGTPRPGPHLEISITDTGSGLGEDTRQRLCSEVFFSTKNRRRGLGLPTACAVLAAYRGGLTFGPGPQLGTVVRLVLPIAPAGETARAQQAV